jgi:hypothetical protein
LPEPVLPEEREPAPVLATRRGKVTTPPVPARSHMGSRLGWRRPRKLAMGHCEPALSIGQSHAADRRPRIGRVERAPASPKSSAMRVIRAATSRKIVSIALSFGHHLSSTHSRISIEQIDNAASARTATGVHARRRPMRQGCDLTTGAWGASNQLGSGSAKHESSEDSCVTAAMHRAQLGLTAKCGVVQRCQSEPRGISSSR